jgi:hypothetical protein
MYVTKKLSSSVLLLNYFTNLINEGAGWNTRLHHPVLLRCWSSTAMLVTSSRLQKSTSQFDVWIHYYTALKQTTKKAKKKEDIGVGVTLIFTLLVLPFAAEWPTCHCQCEIWGNLTKIETLAHQKKQGSIAKTTKTEQEFGGTRRSLPGGVWRALRPLEWRPDGAAPCTEIGPTLLREERFRFWIERG